MGKSATSFVALLLLEKENLPLLLGWKWHLC